MGEFVNRGFRWPAAVYGMGGLGDGGTGEQKDAEEQEDGDDAEVEKAEAAADALAMEIVDRLGLRFRESTGYRASR